MKKPMQNDLGKFNDLMDENLRLRDEIRQYRRLIRDVIPFIGYQAFVPELVEAAEAIVTRRRRKS